MDPATREELKAALVDELERAHRRLAGLERDLAAIVEAVDSDNVDDEHDPEGATLGFERAQVITLRNQTAVRIEELEQSRARLDAGTADSCEVCGATIGRERLLARPGTRRCRACAT